VAVEKGWTYVQWQGQFVSLRAILRTLPPDADFGPSGTRAGHHVRLLHWERQADSMLHALAAGPDGAFVYQSYFEPRALFVGWGHRMRGDRSAAHAAFDLARELMDSVVRERPEDAGVHAARGLALAGLGNRDEALREACWLEQSALYRKDAWFGSNLALSRARILAQAGDAQEALAEIDWLLSRPSELSIHTLRLDPLFDPVRNYPGYMALITKHSAIP